MFVRSFVRPSVRPSIGRSVSWLVGSLLYDAFEATILYSVANMVIREL
jgi:hypothetical protein